jgi:hypothetical protein
MWSYIQDSGSLYTSQHTGRIASGYSGYGSGRNNPELQWEPSIGPIPVGMYTIESPVDTVTHGPFVLPLTPDPTNVMWGRSSFLIHGDRIENAGQYLASHGCIILPRPIREQLWNSGDHILNVIRTYDNSLIRGDHSLPVVST